MPDSPAVDLVRLPRQRHDPRTAVARRIGFALALLVFIAAVVFLGRGGYTDVAGDGISVLDALYYASVTLTTTGYGDISAVTPGTRLATLVLITPARILFLILVVGTTVEVLTEQYRQLLSTQRWRRRVQDHHIICGYGSTGRSAADALLADDVAPATIVVVDEDAGAVEQAATAGFATVHGDASRLAVLRQAAVERARSVVVAPNRDDTAVLITLTARECNSSAHIVSVVRERENKHLLQQSGADAVIDSSAAIGRLLGLATQSPSALTLVDDLLDAGTSLELAEVEPVPGPSGELAGPTDALVIEVLRDGRRLPFSAAGARRLLPHDRLLVIRPTSGGA